MISEPLARDACNQHILTLMHGQNAADWAALLGQYQGAIISCRYPGVYVDLITQRFAGLNDLNMADAYAFAQTNYMLRTAQVAAFCLDVGTEPSLDREHEANDQAVKMLQNATGSFSGGTQGDDGFISWSVPRWGCVLYYDGKSSCPYLVMIPPDRVALEVGTISAAKTYSYLKSRGRLARWPYEQKVITVLTTRYVHGEMTDFDYLVSQCQETAADFIAGSSNPVNHWIGV